MAAKGRQPSQHRRTGAALGYDGAVEELALECECGARHTELVAAEEKNVRRILAGVVCLWCGMLGRMSRARRAC